MNCPQCENTTLVMTERSGVEIDYCPKCRGVWLDRGELDKIIDRAAVESAPPTNAPQPPPSPPFQQQHYQQPPQQHYGKKPDDSDYGMPAQGGQYGYRKKKSWLSEIFD